jgi:hypothetical protein
VITTIAADNLEGSPEAAFLTALHDADQLAPDTRCHAMPKLTSHRDSHDITGLNAAPRIMGVAPARHPDTLRTASRPDTGHNMRNVGAQLNPPPQQARPTAGVWSSTTLSASIVARSCGDKCRTLSWMVATSEDDFDRDAFAHEHRLCESRTAAIQ